MTETNFIIYLDTTQENRYRHNHVWEAGEIQGFRIQYEALIEGKWHSILRYDTAHGQPHRDVLHPDSTQKTCCGIEKLILGTQDIVLKSLQNTLHIVLFLCRSLPNLITQHVYRF